MADARHERTAIRAVPLTPENFAPFGTVIQNPSRNAATSSVPAPESRNQGTAMVYPQITHHISTLDENGSGTTTSHALSVPVPVLERHPYTTQSFLPLGLSPSESRTRAYLVVVAPTLPSPPDSASRFATDLGRPDLDRTRAFLAHGGQGVTYGVGTWHSPMIAIGGTIEFVVLQWDNGIPAESCQEVATASLAVTVPDALFSGVMITNAEIPNPIQARM